MSAADGGGGAGDRTEIDIEEIKAIANDTRGRLAGLGESTTETFRSTVLTGNAMGGLGVGQNFVDLANGAQDLYTSTIRGVLSDLDAFGTNLHTSAAAHESNNDAVAAAFTSFNVDYSEQVSAGNQEGFESGQHDDRLNVDPSEIAADDGPDAAGDGAADGGAGDGAEGGSDDGSVSSAPVSSAAEGSDTDAGASGDSGESGY